MRRKNTQIRLIADDGSLKEDPYDYYAVVTSFPLDLASERAQASERGQNETLLFARGNGISSEARQC